MLCKAPFVIKFADNMKLIVYYIYLSFLLLFGGNYLYANTHHSTVNFSLNQNLEKKEKVKHKNSRNHNILKEIADIEVDEEFHTSDEQNDYGSNKLLAVKQSFLESWYLTFSHKFLFKDFSNNFKIFAPFSVHSNPIYLIIGVFRI